VNELANRARGLERAIRRRLRGGEQARRGNAVACEQRVLLAHYGFPSLTHFEVVWCALGGEIGRSSANNLISTSDSMVRPLLHDGAIVPGVVAVDSCLARRKRSRCLRTRWVDGLTDPGTGRRAFVRTKTDVASAERMPFFTNNARASRTASVSLE